MDTVYRTRRMNPHGRRPTPTRVIVAFWVAVLLIGSVLLWKGAGAISLYVTDFFDKMHASQEKPVNLLLLGVGGGTHDGPDLTDTIIFMHLDPAHKKVSLVSLPRDLWIPDMQAKVNATYTVASEQHPGSGLSVSELEIGKILGQHINYGIKLDFGGFVKAVNILDGLDINVDRTFDDYQYPIDGSEDATCGMSQDALASASAAVANGTAQEQDVFPCRFKHIHFNQGEQHMDGETALEYVRSRHAIGPEGSDFARSKRQEKVISAIKAKLFSAGTIFNPVKVIDLINTLQGSLETDIKAGQYGSFIQLVQEMKGAKITSTVIDDGDPLTGRYGLLVNPPISDAYGGQWVLVPREGATSYSEIQQYVACQLAGENCTVGQYGILTPTPKPTITK